MQLFVIIVKAPRYERSPARQDKLSVEFLILIIRRLLIKLGMDSIFIRKLLDRINRIDKIDKIDNGKQYRFANKERLFVF